MNPKNYQMPVEKALSFDEWRADYAPQFNDEMVTSMNRMHNIDYKKQHEEMMQREYENYLEDLNGNWLLR